MKRIEKLLLVAILFASCLTVTACGERDGIVQGTVQGADPGSNQIQVVIYDLERADQVPGMDVFAKGVILQRTLVDENGGFSFTLPPEEYILQVWLNGIEVLDQMIEVKSGRTTTLELEIAPPSS